MTSLLDVMNHSDWIDETAKSPTACYVTVDFENGEFYRDQQDCAIWKYEPHEGVYIQNECSDGDVIDVRVADTLAEFFARVKIEGSIWRKTNDLDHSEHFTSWREESQDVDGLWSALEKALTSEERDYVNAYRNK